MLILLLGDSFSSSSIFYIEGTANLLGLYFFSPWPSSLPCHAFSISACTLSKSAAFQLVFLSPHLGLLTFASLDFSLYFLIICSLLSFFFLISSSAFFQASVFFCSSVSWSSSLISLALCLAADSFFPSFFFC